MKNGLVINKWNNQCWYKDDLYYRDDDLPAITWEDGSKFWYQHSKDHREDGPADMYADGYNYWWLNGSRYEFDDWCIKLNKSPKEKAYLALKYC